jgi:hypothetical protein
VTQMNSTILLALVFFSNPLNAFGMCMQPATPCVWYAKGHQGRRRLFTVRALYMTFISKWAIGTLSTASAAQTEKFEPDDAREVREGKPLSGRVIRITRALRTRQGKGTSAPFVG